MNTVQRRKRYPVDQVRRWFEPWQKGSETPEGEQRIFCPLCENPATSKSPSASMNAAVGTWNCLKFDDHGGSIIDLAKRLEARGEFEVDAFPERVSVSSASASASATGKPQQALFDQEQPLLWANNLQKQPAKLAWMMEAKGIGADILASAEVGFGQSAFQFPVRVGGVFVQTKSIAWPVDGGKKKITQTYGAKSHLWPEQWLRDAPDLPVLLTEGESDALLAQQEGKGRYVAVTGTGGAGAAPGDLTLVKGREVFVAYDLDDAGRKGALKVVEKLLRAGAVPYILDLRRLWSSPDLDNGEDLGNFFREAGGSAEQLVAEFERLRLEGPEDFKDSERAARVTEAFESMLVQRDARSLLNAEGWEPPVANGSLAEQLAKEPEPVEWHIPGLAFVGGNVLVVAAAKSGKTVLLLNVLHSLVSGDALFGHFEVNAIPKGRGVAWWNAELTENQALDWLRKMDFPRPEDVHPEHLRGYAMPFEVQAVEDWAVQWLRERNVMVWGIDPKSALFSGEENSNTENGEWLKAIDRIKRRAGVETLFLVHHAAESPDTSDEEDTSVRLLKARGATRLQGWADVLWSYSGRFDEPRYLAAVGRDVDTAPFGGMHMNPSTRMLRWNGNVASPSQDRRHRLMLTAVDALSQADAPLRAGELQARMPGRPGLKRAGIEFGVERGYILKADGGGNSILYSLGEPVPARFKLRDAEPPNKPGA